MKKFYLPILALALSVALTACGNAKKESTIESSDESSAETSVTSEQSEETTEINTEAFAEQATEALSYQTCTVDNVSFMVDSSWKPLNGHEGTFATPDEKNVYQLQGVSSLGSYTPEEFFQHLKDIYSESNEIVRSDDTLTSFVTSDSLESYIGRIDMKVNGIFFSIDVLIVPQKNTVVTFAGQSPSENDLSVDVRNITKTASFISAEIHLLPKMVRSFVLDLTENLFIINQKRIITSLTVREHMRCITVRRLLINCRLWKNTVLQRKSLKKRFLQI